MWRSSVHRFPKVSLPVVPIELLFEGFFFLERRHVRWQFKVDGLQKTLVPFDAVIDQIDVALRGRQVKCRFRRLMGSSKRRQLHSATKMLRATLTATLDKPKNAPLAWPNNRTLYQTSGA